MKLIIDISDDLYKTKMLLPDDMCGIFERVVKNGIPFNQTMERMTEDLNEAYKRGYEDGIKIRKEVRQEVMTLDEAIKHCEEVAEEKENEGRLLCQSEGASIGCLTCAEEHRQLAEWLKELKEYREQEPTHPCDLCAFNNGEFCRYLGECPAIANGERR